MLCYVERRSVGQQATKGGETVDLFTYRPWRLSEEQPGEAKLERRQRHWRHGLKFSYTLSCLIGTWFLFLLSGGPFRASLVSTANQMAAQFAMEEEVEVGTEVCHLFVEHVEQRRSRGVPVGRAAAVGEVFWSCLLYTSPSPRDRQKSRMPSSA